MTDTLVDRLRAAGCVFAEAEASLLRQAATGSELEAMFVRRVAGEPLEQVVGWARFCDERIVVTPGVFVPRPRTEPMALRAVDLARRRRADGMVVDLCCGSGAIATIVRRRLSDVEVHAADIDPVAVRCARRNVEPLGGHVHEGDLYDALPTLIAGRVAVLVANVPYVPRAEIELLPRDAREHEALVALDGGVDGLDVLRRVAAGAGDWLVLGGVVLCETSRDQAAAAVAIFEAHGLVAAQDLDEDLDVVVVRGRRT